MMRGHDDKDDGKQGGKGNFAARMMTYRKGKRAKKRGKARKSSR